MTRTDFINKKVYPKEGTRVRIPGTYFLFYLLPHMLHSLYPFPYLVANTPLKPTRAALPVEGGQGRCHHCGLCTEYHMDQPRLMGAAGSPTRPSR